MNASDLLPSSECEAGMLATARNQAGGPASRLTDNSVVKYQGMDMELRTAAALGLVTRNADGTYSERGAAQSGQPTQPPIQDASQQQEQQDEDPVTAFEDQATETAFAAFAQEVPEGLQGGIVAAFIGDALDGSSSSAERALAQAAGASGIDPQRMQAGAAVATRGFQSQANALVTKSGAEPEAFWTWARANQPEALGDAVRQHVYGRKLGGYRPLLDAYFKANMPSTEALRRGGYETKTEGRTVKNPGVEMVQIDGQWMEVRVAARLGLV
jgi:hypothetical protein